MPHTATTPCYIALNQFERSVYMNIYSALSTYTTCCVNSATTLAMKQIIHFEMPDLFVITNFYFILVYLILFYFSLWKSIFVRL